MIGIDNKQNSDGKEKAAENTAIQERLAALRKVMEEKQVNWCLFVTSDPHGSEYINACYESRRFFSGFTGSNGDLLVGLSDALLWTDGRYFVQAEKELAGTGIKMMKMGDDDTPKLTEYIKSRVCAGERLISDGRMLSASNGIKIAEILKKKRAIFLTDEDPAAWIWTDRPADSTGEITILPDKLTGKNAAFKLSALSSKIRETGASSHVITSLDDQMWLFNIRGCDIECNPVAYAYTVINGRNVSVYLKEPVSPTVKDYFGSLNVNVRNYDNFYADLEKGNLTTPVTVDPAKINYRAYQLIRKKGKIVEHSNPTGLMKAIKNEREIANMKDIYVLDSAVLTIFLHYIKKNAKSGDLNEYDAAMMLDNMRSQIEGFNDLSFPTISAFGPNAAMMHYEATETDHAKIEANGLYLVDSGGQYDGGTTDVTRTLVLGKVSEEIKRQFTRVVVGMLRLQNAIFLEGCAGRNLDIMAREPVWELCMDYKCGTGHGVGYMLNVHEGPHSIRWRPGEGKEEPLKPGMIVSDEPGVYVAGSHGIRIENILLCKEVAENDDGRFLTFEPLTYVPIDLDGILPDEMEPRDKALLNAYHKAVRKKLMPFMEGDDISWLKEATREI
ncbi:MAG: aminopeptidase P family protein [Lachnospiraceae bacterium]|nr:aminopeptidase P family protein [Lachnospiraceae bacterium]